MRCLSCATWNVYLKVTIVAPRSFSQVRCHTSPPAGNIVTLIYEQWQSCNFPLLPGLNDSRDNLGQYWHSNKNCLNEDSHRILVILFGGFTFWQHPPVEYHAIAVALYSTNARLRLINIGILFLINFILISMYKKVRGHVYVSLLIKLIHKLQFVIMVYLYIKQVNVLCTIDNFSFNSLTC